MYGKRFLVLKKHTKAGILKLTLRSVSEIACDCSACMFLFCLSYSFPLGWFTHKCSSRSSWWIAWLIEQFQIKHPRQSFPLLSHGSASPKAWCHLTGGNSTKCTQGFVCLPVKMKPRSSALNGRAHAEGFRFDPWHLSGKQIREQIVWNAFCLRTQRTAVIQGSRPHAWLVWFGINFIL